MKKLLAMALIASIVALPGLALAEHSRLDAADGGQAGNPDKQTTSFLPVEGDVPAADKDIVTGESEFRIISVEENSPEDTSGNAPVAGEDTEAGEDEAKMVSIDTGLPYTKGATYIQRSDASQDGNKTLLFAGIGASSAALAGAGILFGRKRKKMSR